MPKYIRCLIIIFFPVIAYAQLVPVTKKLPVTISKHNISYHDDYAWLEAMESDEVINWRNAQNEYTNLHLKEIKKKWSSASKIKEYDHYSSNGLPKKKKKYYYSVYILNKDRPASLFFREKLNDIPIEILNPYKIYKDVNVGISNISPSVNSTLIAVKISKDGSERMELRFVDMAKLSVTDEVLTNVRSNVEWNQDRGVFYKKKSNVRTFEKDSTFQLFYHKIGTLQQDDILIYDTTATENQFWFDTFGDKFILCESNSENGKKVYYQASLKSEPFAISKFLETGESDADFLGYRNGRVFFTTKAYDWGEVRSYDIDNVKDEKVIVPQIYTHLLTHSNFFEDYLVCEYKILGKNYMIVYDANGKFIRRFDVPDGMNFKINFYNPETKNLFVTFYSYTIPYLNYTLNMETGKSNPYFNDFLPPKPTLFPFDHFTTTTITYKSRDNEDVPITIVYKKGLQLDGNNPTLLKAYGGYGAVSGPVYDTGLLYFLEKGGVYAYAEIRGGGEKGLKWHEAGKGLNKINAFNDFIDAAEFLISQKYTSPNKLAITGTSHGGLVVGVAMTKRPDLFKVAIPRMGVFDMAQYGKFTVGEMNYKEYGNPEQKKEYQSLLAYSPYHNIDENVNYPTTLIITSDNDQRVPPVHAYKFAARLQNRAAQKNPIYLETLDHTGHFGKQLTYNESVGEDADFYNFLLYHLNQ